MKKSIFFVICISLLTANGLFAQLNLIKAASAPPNCSLTSLYENGNRLGYLTAAPVATLQIFGNNGSIPGFAVTSFTDFSAGNYIKLLQGDMGIYQHNTSTTSYNYFTSKSIFTNNLGIGAFTSSALPTAPLHLKGSTFLMESGLNTPMVLKNGSLGGSFEFWVKYDDNSSKTIVDIKALTLSKDGLIATKGSYQLLSVGNLSANQINVSTKVNTAALRMYNGAADNYILKSDEAGNGSWVNPTTMFPQLNLWQQNSNQTIYTDAPAVGIGTSSMGTYKLAVNGTIGCKEVIVEDDSDTWPDYVFTPDYTPMSLDEIRTFIKENGHLPDAPSAQEVKQKGINVGQMNALLLKKVEELTLHIIELQDQLNSLKKEANK